MNARKPLTAGEAADRIAVRSRHSNHEIDTETIPPYRCEVCGGDRFRVFCSGDGVTAEGELTDDHHIDWFEREANGDEESPEPRWEIRCADCDHEIEFGWSHPDRGGRLWPCESLDFNPWKSWPEPRFREAWLKRGWIPQRR